MKFTKEEFLETLKAQNEAEKLLSEKTLQGMEALYGFAGESEEMNVFVERISPILKTFGGQVRKMNADHFKEKAEWKKQQPKPQEVPEDKKDEPSDKLDELLREIGELKKEREAEKAAKTIEDKRAALKNALKSKDVRNEDWINDQLDLITVSADTDVDGMTERLVKSYNKFSAAMPNPQTPSVAGAASNAQDADFKKIRAMREAQIKREKEQI